MGMHYHAVSIGQQVISHQIIAVIDAIHSSQRCLLYLGCSFICNDRLIEPHGGHAQPCRQWASR